MRRRAAALSFVTISLVLLAACGGGAARPTDASGRRPTVESTVAPITDIVRQVVGDRVKLAGLIPEGVDSHTFEPSPKTVKSLAEADVLFVDGLHLEESTLEHAAATMPASSQIVRLGDLTLSPADYAYDATFPKEKGDPNPHLWMDPVYAGRWSEVVRDTMVARDAANAEYYRANQREFAAVLGQLDSAIRQAVDSIPAEHRRLLTYHDSFAYFSRRYGVPVIGAVQPSDFSEPSPRDIQALVDQVKANRVPAIFGSEVFPSKVLEQVAAQSGARFVDTVRDDALPGKPGDPEHTYVGMMVDDVTVITQALGGDPAPLARVPTARTWAP
jgi:manganese/iron transport system substrate-binding protein